MLAKDNMRAQRGTAILVGLVLLLTTVLSVVLDELALRFAHIAVYVLVFTVGLLILFVMGVNSIGEYIKIFRGEPARVSVLFTGLKERFGRKLGGALWMTLWLALWTSVGVPVIAVGLAVLDVPTLATTDMLTVAEMELLMTMIAPGTLLALFLVSVVAFIPMFIKSLAYSMVFYILADCPQVTAREALRLSKRMTRGHKGKVFMMMLSFIGWSLLSVPTLGILWIVYVGPYYETAFAGLYMCLRDNAVNENKIAADEFGLALQENTGTLGNDVTSV